MRLAFSLLAVPLLLTLSVGCARPQVATPSQIDAAVARKDTVTLAHLALRECGPKAESVRQTCYEDFFGRLADSNRVHIALGALAALAADHPEIEMEGHSFTHVIGIRAWQPGADVATIFRGCTGLFQSGCYHGVIQAYLIQDGNIDSARAVGLCDVIAPGSTDRWLRFQCVHGLGHGFEMAWNWELPRALTGCDWLHDNWDRASCYGGVFMENAVASMPGDHHTATHAMKESEGDTGNMAMGGMIMPDPHKITFKMRDSSDALYPCSIVGDKYQRACYELQGGLILAQTHSDFAKAALECDKVTVAVRSECYLSLGTNASGMTLRDTPKAIADCLHGDPGYQPFCFEGVV
ncbi:MAG TPA: hypothetical protein VHW65_00320, partial [Gemmatimonadales bacterium]|nr:hypothetical protein [Gemmatimonadales bacterium]